MGRLREDFAHVFRALGGRNALKYVLYPRLLSHLRIKDFSQNKLCANFFEENFPDVLRKWKNVTLCHDSIVIPNRIWIFWWQGVEQMPFVISKCYESILLNANGREVVVLDQCNYKNYVDISSFILRKFESGKISITHFSDIIRVLLLQKYGGIWIDAAIYVTRPIPKVDTLFYSPKLSHVPSEAPHMNLWVMGIMGAPSQMPLFSYISEMLMCYWKKYNGVLTYLLFDHIIRYGYENFTWVKELMDNREIESPNLHESRYTFNQEVDKEKLEVLLSNNSFFSLTYRVPYPLLSEDGKQTYFSALMEVNDKRINNEKDNNRGR